MGKIVHAGVVLRFLSHSIRYFGHFNRLAGRG